MAEITLTVPDGLLEDAIAHFGGAAEVKAWVRKTLKRAIKSELLGAFITPLIEVDKAELQAALETEDARLEDRYT